MNDSLGEQIWARMMKNQNFLMLNNAAKRAVLRPHILALPDFLDDLLHKPVSLITFFEAKRRYKQALLDGNYAEAMVAARSQNVREEICDQDACAVLRKLIQFSISYCTRILEIIPLVTKSMKMDAVELVSEGRTFLSSKNVGLARTGNLTIRELLLDEPFVLL